MLEETKPFSHRPGCHQILAGRLLQLADDSDRVGLHREASVLASFAASVSCRDEGSICGMAERRQHYAALPFLGAGHARDLSPDVGMLISALASWSGSNVVSGESIDEDSVTDDQSSP